MSETCLLDLQRWMTIVVQHRQDSATAIRSKQASALVPSRAALAGEIVTPSATMSPTERLDVYNGGYLSRLYDSLKSDFPGLIHALGDDGFFDLAQNYVQQHPSQHQNLIFFARQLPEFIATQRTLPNRAFLRDLAKLEWFMGESFHAEVSRSLDANALQRLDPAQWQNLVLQMSPALRLLQASYPVDEYLQGVFDVTDPKIPARKTSYVAIYRKEYQVWRRRLSATGYKILLSLAAGKPFGAALRHAGKDAHLIGNWFQDWSADGLFLDYSSNPTS